MNEQTLYGRSPETRRLHDAFAAARSQCPPQPPHIVILTGPSGVGKRALAESLRPIVESSEAGSGGLFLSGRCRPDSDVEQRRKVRPSGAFCEVIEDLIDSTNETAKVALRNVITRSQLFTPSELESLSEILASVDRFLRLDGVATSTSTTQASSSSSVPAFLRGINSLQEQCRLLARFIRAASTCVPLVLHLHQAQCADHASVQLLECFLADDIDFRANTKGLLIVASIQDDVELTPPMVRFLRALEDKTTVSAVTSANEIHRIIVSNITRDDVYQWTVKRLTNRCLSERSVREVTDLIFNHSSGNPQFVRYLVGYLEHSFNESLDDVSKLEEFRERFPSRIDDMFKLIVQQQDSLVQRLVETVAAVKECSGVVDCQLVELLLDESCAQALSTAQGCGILELVHGRIRFCLPKSQVTAYSMIPESKRASVHLAIGWSIWNQYSSIADAGNSYVTRWLNLMACQLQRGISDVTNAVELSTVTNISFSAGKHAMQSSDFVAAASHFDFAISVLGEDKWKSDKYELCLSLHNCGAEAHYCVGDFDSMDRLLTAVLDNAVTFQDKLQAYTAQVYTNGARHRLKEAVQTALDVLKKLGEPIPSKPSKFTFIADYLKTRWMLRSKTDRFFLSLPDATNASEIAAMQMLNFFCIYSYVSNPELGALAVFRLLRLSVRYGMTGPAVPAYSAYGFLLCAHFGLIKEGLRFGQIALALLDQHDARAWLPRIYFYVYGHTQRWGKPFRDSLAPLRLAHKSALNTGDYEGSVLTASTYVITMFYASEHVTLMEQESRSFCQTMDTMGQTLGLPFVVPRWSLFCDLAGNGPMPLELSGEVTDAASALNIATRENNNLAIFLWHVNAVIFACLCGDYQESMASARKAKDASKISDLGLIFYEGLSALANARDARGQSRKMHITIGQGAAKKFQSWAQTCPENFQNKQSLLEAELSSIYGKWEKAALQFETSIQGAQREGLIHEEGLAYYRFGQYHCYRNQTKSAIDCFRSARDAFQRWGAVAIVRRIDARLDELPGSSPERTPEAESCTAVR